MQLFVSPGGVALEVVKQMEDFTKQKAVGEALLKMKPMGLLISEMLFIIHLKSQVPDDENNTLTKACLYVVSNFLIKKNVMYIFPDKL